LKLQTYIFPFISPHRTCTEIRLQKWALKFHM